VLGAFFRLAQAIPIAPMRADPAGFEPAFERARAVLDAGELLCIFMPGAPACDGSLGTFEARWLALLERHPVPVVPLALRRSPPRGWFGRVGLVAGAALAPASVTPAVLRERVSSLLAS
jgi:hypothetical protein